jgi:hypothetical protein
MEIIQETKNATPLVNESAVPRGMLHLPQHALLIELNSISAA